MNRSRAAMLDSFELSPQDEAFGRLVVECEIVGLFDIVRCVRILRDEVADGLPSVPLADVMEEEGLINVRLRASLEEAAANIARKDGPAREWSYSLVDLLPGAEGKKHKARGKSRTKAPAADPPAEAGAAIASKSGRTSSKRRAFESVTDALKQEPMPPPETPPKTPTGRLTPRGKASRSAKSVPTDEGPDAPKSRGLGFQRAKPDKKSNPRTGRLVTRGSDSLRDEQGITPKEEPPDAVRQKQLCKIVNLLIKGRSYEAVIKGIMSNRMKFIKPRRIAEQTGLSERQVSKVLKDWEELGMVERKAPNLFAFKPKAAQVKDIRYFLELRRDPVWGTKIVAMLLEAEEH